MVFLFILIILTMFILTSKIKLEVKDLKFYSKQTFGLNFDSYLNNKFNIRVKLLMLGFLPIFWININKEKIDKIKQNEKLKSFKFNNIGKKISLKNIGKANEKINIKINKFYLKTQIGTESTVLTTAIIPTISTIIAIILAKKKVKKINQSFKINPIYNSRKCIKS